MSYNNYGDGLDLEEEGLDEFAGAEIPTSLKGLRACKRCSLVKGNDQFVNHGCENCPFLQMESDQARVQDCTTTYFSGLIAMMDPESSWVGKWQRISECRPGMYAIEVVGELPGEVLEFLEQKRIPFHCKPPDSAK
ncbi:conserved unknown protein [Ectocarpus siliculosus]|uniref:Spt4/RpoE2 zinc finger domain-containing protein n=1 Tax=Ectocarpus siliculosus TaxID=2880 RepID=D7G3E5_ECTSI|nr:conserved unknown protein [Ectocarpus siliculosus]|eukprot:CBJ33539.1 conserved unknown protein [Ectocarpus siliculosus]